MSHHQPHHRPHQHHRALRFLTAGSVDDGKSTLIGRLLFDSRSILADQLLHLEQRAAGAPIDLSLLTDGLEAEREQGITIDVAFRYFATPARKFIIADAPGHEQYTRNMVTAAAGSDAAVVLVDPTKLDFGAATIDLLPQTRRHALLAHLLRVPHIVFAVNKIDALDDPASAFARVRDALEAFARDAGIAHSGILPVSALRGDNVCTPSPLTPWYHGPTLLALLEGLDGAEGAEVNTDVNTTATRSSSTSATSSSNSSAQTLRLPVQYVARVGDGANVERVLWGRIAAGSVRAGDDVTLSAQARPARVARVLRAGEEVGSAGVGESVGLVLDRDVDVSRGDWVLGPASTAEPTTVDAFDATLAWLDTDDMHIGRKYLVRHAHAWVPARIVALQHRVDIQTLRTHEAQQLHTNDIGVVRVQLQTPLALTDYADNRTAGALIVVDPSTHRTCGALLVQGLGDSSAATPWKDVA
jgi:sulfate adenylyltransferase subunit 1